MEELFYEYPCFHRMGLESHISITAGDLFACGKIWVVEYHLSGGIIIFIYSLHIFYYLCEQYFSAMGKKKKKKSGLTEHQQRKVEDAQRRKLYLKRLLAVLEYLKYDTVIPLLTPELLNEFWLARTALARVDLSRATHFGNLEKQFIQRELYALFNHNYVVLDIETEEKREILISDFYEIWLPLMLAIGRDSPKLSETKVKVLLREELKKYGVFCERVDDDTPSLQITQIFERMEHHYQGYLLTFAFQFSNPCMHFFWIEKMSYESHGGRMNRDVIFSSSNPVTVIGRVMKGTLRKLYKVGYPLLSGMKGKIHWLSKKIPRNPYIQFNPDLEYEVYIQEHAMVRMFERIDGVFTSTVNTYMHLCFLNWNVDWYKGSLLIRFDLHGQKVGYFVADFTPDRKIAIRTFYFITYDRTPEGEALASYAGLQAFDKKYLGIDRLSTFLASDFEKDSKFASLCREAGVGHLLDLSAVRHAIHLENTEAKSISNDFIEKYLSSLEK
ncbi:MAG: hypothetical protein Q4G48_10270 [Bacteroidia bacterium]|nr:hypothetical protein [Bacteroidia bacterium]